MLVVLTGCVGTDATVAAPTATVDGGRPPDYASAGSVGSGPVAQVADQTVFTPAAAPDTTVPFAAAADGIVESMVWVPAGDHRVPGTLAMPASPPAGAIPVVLLLHGDLSDRNENGDLFTRLAEALAAARRVNRSPFSFRSLRSPCNSNTTGMAPAGGEAGIARVPGTR